MLDNEPEGGERTGSQPAAETAETTPVRRTRTTRRRTGTAAAAEQPAAEAAATPEAAAPEAAAEQPPVKAVRRRRKAVVADQPDDSSVSAQDAANTPDVTESGAAEAPTAPVKATRTRRKKAVPAVAPVETVAEPAAEAPVVAATPATTDPAPVGAVGEPVVPPAPEAGPPATAPAEAEPVEEAPRTRRRRAALSAPTVLFMAPEPEEPQPRRRRAAAVEPVEAAPAAVEPAAVEPAAAPEGDEAAEEAAEPTRRRRRGRRTAEVAETVTEEPAAVEEEADEAEDEDEDEETDETGAVRRRRRRGRRGRGRGKGGADEGDEDEEESAEAQTDEDDEESGEGDEEGEGLTRRRRRRRRKGAGDVESAAEDGVHTVVRIREPRRTTDEVQGVSGSTRLEAKRQRRRDGREQRRTRPPILSESEFLARREAVDRVMVVRQRGDRTQIAVLEDGVLVEHYVTRASAGTMAGNVYLGKVQNVLPSMEAAFVDVGRGRNAVLYAGEVNWDSTGLEGRARSIEQALRSGDAVLVQVTKDPIGHKGARLTSHIALSGRHLVYVPGGNASGISRKLPDNERKRLRDILKKLIPEGAGVIVRTAAEGATEDELARDVKRLQAQWEDIQAKAAQGGAPALLSEEPDLVIRVVRDLFNEDFRELVVQGDGAYEMVESYLAHVSPDLVNRLRRHTAVVDVFADLRIDEQILKGLDRKVFLPSGGHLVIDRTEAMTVVDVNTGKYTGAGGNLEETVTRNNLEAAEEIVRQLRLRDLGGIVVIDFIDMVLESNRELVLRRLTECLGRDRTKHQVTEITSLGLVQMTRKRIGAGLLEAFSETCDCCKGRGLIIHTEPVPEKPKTGGAAERVKAVAAAPAAAPAAPATTAAPAPTATTSGTTRRRGRKVTVAEPAPPPASDYEDTMGYDLSRYETETSNGVVETPPVEPTRLAGAGDPDAVDESGEGDDDESGSTGRRRARRGSTRRRTRP